MDSIAAQLNALQTSVDSIAAVQALQQVLLDDIHIRLDLDTDNQNTYADDAAFIRNDVFVLNKVDNGDGTFDINRVAAAPPIGSPITASIVNGISTTEATTDITGYQDDDLNGLIVTWLDGNLEDETAVIVD